MIENFFSKYLTIAQKADILFKSIADKYPLSVKCRIHCCDCCYAVFGVLPIEAAFINYHFNRLERKLRRDILRRAEKAEAEILKAKDTLKLFDDKPQVKLFGLGKQRVRCPLLNEKEECVMYEKRPVICRIYGVPFSFKGNKKEQAYVCGLSAFEEKVTYPTIKLDLIYNELCKLSRDLLIENVPLRRIDYKSTLMLPLSRILRMPFDRIMKGDFEE